VGGWRNRGLGWRILSRRGRWRNRSLGRWDLSRRGSKYICRQWSYSCVWLGVDVKVNVFVGTIVTVEVVDIGVAVVSPFISQRCVTNY